MTQYHVACSLPGLRRGGRENPAFASYEIGDHSAEQLQALLDEPAITVVAGVVLTPELIPQLLAHAPEPAGDGKAGKTAKG